jgi:thiamine-monophosphate kinase
LNTPSSVADAGEHALIALIQARVPPAPDWVHLGIGDDAAVIEPARNTLDVVTTDALVEGVHFDRRFVTPADIGFRALAINLSDLAAMGATPRVALLSLILPPDLPFSDFGQLVDGLLDGARTFGVTLAGGNITRSTGPLIVDITALGSVGRRRVLSRSGASPGDQVWVSGRIGAAAAGLLALRENRPLTGLDACVAAYRRPEPRVRLGQVLGRNRAVSACVDLSDGLADGLHQLAAASGVRITIDAESVPVPAEAASIFGGGPSAINAALCGGDDYELLFTVPPKKRGRFQAARRLIGLLPLTRIGAVAAGTGVVVRNRDEDRDLPMGYVHFR